MKSAIPSILTDIDVNRPVPQTRLYEIEGIRFRGVSPYQMIADKVCVVSSDVIFRRIKDVVDLYYLSKTFPFDRDKTDCILKDTGKTLGSFSGFLYRDQELRHSYEKFRFAGDVNKPVFEEMYDTVKEYLKDILPTAYNEKPLF